MSFKDKVVLITGGGSGIGAGAAKHLAKLGANVAIVGRTESKLISVAEQIKKDGFVEPLVIVADVSKDYERIVNETDKRFGRIDVLVNSAGNPIRDTVMNADPANFRRIFDTNVFAAVMLTKFCVPHLEKTKGNVVNVSSVFGMRPSYSKLTYNMARAAMNSFTQCTALDLAPKGIRINSIHPSCVRTEYYLQQGMTKEASDELDDAYARVLPVGRVAEVTDTSAAIEFLADNTKSSFLTGILLPVDGGSLLLGVYSAMNKK